MGYTPNYLGHVNIYVRNAEKSQSWYQDILGLHTYDFVPGRAAFMSANLNESHEIALMEVGEEAPGVQNRQVGLNHMAWRMSTLDDLKEFYVRLKDKGISSEAHDHGISIGIYFKDPDGNVLQNALLRNAGSAIGWCPSIMTESYPQNRLRSTAQLLFALSMQFR